jgi:hypothetical protein
VKIDSLVIHADDIQAGSGVEFYGTSIREVNLIDVDVREELDTVQRVRMGFGTDIAPVELLPDEVIKSNAIRRTTTAEVIGYDKFHTPETPEGQQVPIDVARSFSHAGLLITWRPGNQDFAVIHEEVPSELPI